MNQKTLRGLVVAASLIILAAVLYYLFTGSTLKPGPSAVTAPGPATAPGQPALPAAALPQSAPQPPLQETPAPAIEPGGPPQGASPGPESKVTVLPPQEVKEHFGILAGSFGKYPGAARLLARLKKQGKPAFVQRDPRDVNRFQVWLGPFSSQNEAQEAAKSLQATLKKPVKIEPIENPVPK
jgi:cell division septation protein DedD